MNRFSNYSDEELVKLYCGDPNTRTPELEELIDRYHNLLIGWAFSRLKDPCETEDVVQKVWLGVLKNLCTKFNSERKFKTWLSGILQYKIIDRFRELGREKSLPNEKEASFAPERDLKEVLKTCIVKIPEKYYVILLLLLIGEKLILQYDAKLISDFKQKTKTHLEYIFEEFSLYELKEKLFRPHADLVSFLRHLKKTDTENAIRIQRYRAIKMLQDCLQKNGYSS